MIIRKSPRYLTTAERNQFIKAIVALKNRQEKLSDGTTIGRYDQHVAIHLGVTARLKNGAPVSPLDGGHGGPGFLPWHREYLLRIEQDLQNITGKTDLAIPFWDWTDTETTFDIIFKDTFLGEYHPGVVEVTTASFAIDDNWKLDPRVRIRMVADLITNPSAQVPQFGDNLTRRFRTKSTLPTKKTIEFILNQIDYDSFRVAIEHGTDPHYRTHDYMHNWVGGVMRSHASPYDPIFMLNHAYIDRLWALWQALGHHGTKHYTKLVNAGRGHAINSQMWPWDGNAPVETVERLEKVLPSFANTDERKPRDVLDCRELDRSYVHWSRVKEILDAAIARWSEERDGLQPRLTTIHGNQFSWSTRDKLLTATARGKRLIEPAQIGVNKGYQTNLVVALKEGFVAENIRRMPAGDPPLSLLEIAEVAHWIDMGCPDDKGSVI